MKLTQLKKKSAKELVEHADVLRENIALKKRSYVMGEVTDNKELTKLKRELARTLTLINEVKENK